MTLRGSAVTHTNTMLGGLLRKICTPSVCKVFVVYARLKNYKNHLKCVKVMNEGKCGQFLRKCIITVNLSF